MLKCLQQLYGSMMNCCLIIGSPLKTRMRSNQVRTRCFYWDTNDNVMTSSFHLHLSFNLLITEYFLKFPFRSSRFPNFPVKENLWSYFTHGVTALCTSQFVLVFEVRSSTEVWHKCECYTRQFYTPYSEKMFNCNQNFI